MHPKAKQTAQITLALIMIFAALFLVYEIIILLIGFMKTLEPNLAAGFLTAFTTVVASISAITLGKYFERKKEIESHFRDKKVKIYDDFLIEFYKLFGSDDENYETGDGVESDLDLVPFLRDWQRKIILWGGADVVASYIKWMKHISSNEPNAQSMFLTEDFFKALRKDIGLSSKGLMKGDFIHLILRNSDLFFTLAKKNPDITLAEMGEIERQLKTLAPQEAE